MEEKKDWFATWFDSVYYHRLYNHRDEMEAENFIDHLVSELHIPQNSIILDLACGKGRHSKYLHQKGMIVTGVDLSLASIDEARLMEEVGLEFYTHDMRANFRMNYYNYILNLFTSFGYFKTERENIKVLESAHNGLKSGGVFVMDFLNETYVIDRLVKEEKIDKDGLIFHIRRKIEKGFIIKNIRFSDLGKDYEYEERVRAFTLEELKEMLERVNFQIKSIHGNYQLDPFELKKSSRLILTAIKN